MMDIGKLASLLLFFSCQIKIIVLKPGDALNSQDIEPRRTTENHGEPRRLTEE
jgi:hypothetical protein